MRRVGPAAVILSAAALVAHAQSTAITGRVVADDGGSPIPNARVSLTIAAAGAPVVLTDADGTFSFAGPPSGRYTVAASKTGYARREVSSTGSQPIEIRLIRSAVVSGRVVDEFGDPVLGARVVAETRSTAASTRPPVAVTDTDDRGEYRLIGLPAGTVVV